MPLLSSSYGDTTGLLARHGENEAMVSGTEEAGTGFAARLGLFLARFCTSAWIGAASLFVIVGIMEVTRAGFDSTTKDVLVSIRFPAFYVCGAVLMTLAGAGAFLAGNSNSFPRSRRISSLILLGLVLAIMAIDYVWIYQPLLKIVTPPGQTKPATFARYHDASKWINLTGLTLCLIVATLVNWPAAPSKKSLPD